MIKSSKATVLPKICFIAPNAYELLTGKNLKRVVGPDVHQVLLAKELVSKGFRVSMIVYCKDNSASELIDDIEIIKIRVMENDLSPVSELIKGLAFWKALSSTNADIYYIHGGVPGIISLYCYIYNKISIYSIASDAWVSKKPIKYKLKGFNHSILSIEYIGNCIDIMLATQIIIQTEHQRRLLKQNFNKEGTLIRTPFPMPSNCCLKVRSKIPTILWVGSLSDVKRPDLFVELAKKMPNLKFLMVGGYAGDGKKYVEMLKNTCDLTNFEYAGVVQYNKIHEIFEKVDILVNTSLFEGFPHAFIQAWAYQLPIVSLNADPDGLLTNHNLGICSHSIDQMVEDIEKILSDDEFYEKIKTDGLSYVARNHDIKNISKSYIDLFLSLVHR